MQISYSHTIYYLLLTQFKIFKRIVLDKLFDLAIWVFITAAVTIYLLPSFGLAHSYGSFTIAGLVASAGLFEQWNGATQLISDFEGDNITQYYLTLPMASWVVFAAYMIFYALNTGVLMFGVLPVCKIFFGKHLDFSEFSLFYYVLMFVVSCIFFAAFTLWLVGMIKDMEHSGSVWMRFIYPLWTLGGFQFSYEVMSSFNPTLGYVSLCNPLLYLMEGTRAAILGQEGYINIWVCVAVVLIFSVLFALHGLHRIKKRLDYV